MKKLNYLIKGALIVALLCLPSCKNHHHETNKKSSLPTDLKLNATPQEAANFAWATFLSINELAPNSKATKWENYKEAYDIFLPNAEKPSPWGELTPTNNPPCESYTSGKVLRTTSKVSPVISETDQAVGGVLIDRNTNLVHYEVYMNKPMFEYVVNNEFYNAITQAGSNINFPNGSMELKASWRILDPNKDDLTRYHTAEAVIYVPDSVSIRTNDCLPKKVKQKMEVCSKKLVGLVGLHIVYKTPSNQNFTWFTFEQIDNVNSHVENGTMIPASFRNKKTAVSYCPDNSRQCDCPDQKTSQITRQNPIPDWVKEVNKDKWKTLKKENSIWQYYELIGVQWARDTTRIGNPLLKNLANTSMETFNQTASSCIGCHSFARSTNPTVLSDFSWVMGRAQLPKSQLPEANKKALLKYVMKENPYQKWGTWPNTAYNTFDVPTAGENPHGKTIRIYVNDIATTFYKNHKNTLSKHPKLPVGSIVLKENYRTPPSDTPTPSDLVELTIMYKALNPQGQPQWFWMKTRPYGPVDVAGFNLEGCISCHMNWKGNGDGMLSFNFGRRPVITETPYSNKPISQKEIKEVQKHLVNIH